MKAIQNYAFSLLSKELAMEHYGLVEAEAKQEAPKQAFGEARLAGDDDVFIYFPGDELTVGSPVFSDEAMEEMLIDGDYELDGGAMIVVAEGMVAEISEAGDEEEAPAEEEEAEKEDNNAEFAAMEEFFAPHLEAFNALAETVTQMQEQFATILEQAQKNTEKVESLSKASAVVHKPNAKSVGQRQQATENFRNLTASEKIRKMRNKAQK